jgi:hypothetical protein
MLKKKNIKPEYKDNKGNWEFSFFQKYIVENEEQNIKKDLRPLNIFNPKKIHEYINPQISKEEIIENKFLDNIKLNKTEEIIYNNYIKNKNEKLEKDMNNIKTLGNKAKPTTLEGKIHLIMYLLDIEIKKNSLCDISNICYNNIVSIYLKLQDFALSKEIKETYQDSIDKMNKIIDSVDLTKLQFTLFYSQMPPLNNGNKGFKKFDDWQIKVIENIDNNISTIVSAPTSAGKSVLSGYAVTKGRTLFVVPTDALAWQMASYIGYIINIDVPIITLTYQSIPKRDEFIAKLNSSLAIVGTADLIVDYLPFINCNFSWIIFDEIHMIGSHEGSDMEIIAKMLPSIPFLALSATIGNLEELKDFFVEINPKKVECLKCDKRFFNLQKYYYDTSLNEMKILSPLSLIDEEQIVNKSILNKTLDPTPTDTWILVQKLLNSNIDIGNLHPSLYFNKNEIIELSKSNQYFSDLLKFIVDNYNDERIKKIISEYINIDFEHSNSKLLNFIFLLKENNKFPAIIFQQNTIACLKIIRQLSVDIDTEEEKKYPNLYNERVKKDKQNKQFNKKIEKETKDLTEKQEQKKMLLGISNEISIIESELINAPHEDFIFNVESKISSNDIKELHEKFKMYFPCINGDYHFLIRLLWRGIGVYTVGLPDNYLRLIQSLASQKKLAIVFSDQSLVFGVSMPFRSSVIYHDNNAVDNLNPMIYHQMAGRAGRRGLDKEGNIIFIGYSSKRIKELSTSPIPIVNILNKKIYSNNVTGINNYWNNKWNTIFQDNINSQQLIWNLRSSNECIIVAFIFPYMQKFYNNASPSNENDQIDIAYFISNFIHIFEPKDETEILQNINVRNINYGFMYDKLKELDIEVNQKINNKIWLSIKKNALVELDNDELRQRLFDFSIKIRIMQHYAFHNKYVNLTKLLGKLLTRIWWVYFGSAPLIRS